MHMLIEIMLGMVHLTMPATAVPVTYSARSHDTVIAYSADAGGWVPVAQCGVQHQCVTRPDEPVHLLRGEISLQDLADLRVEVRKDGNPRFVWFGIFFGGRPVYWTPR